MTTITRKDLDAALAADVDFVDYGVTLTDEEIADVVRRTTGLRDERKLTPADLRRVVKACVRKAASIVYAEELEWEKAFSYARGLGVTEDECWDAFQTTTPDRLRAFAREADAAFRAETF